MNSFVISVREFAVPVPRVGSIEPHSGYSESASLGQEIHTRIQEQRQEEFSEYESEVEVSGEFQKGDYSFRVRGRMDGLFLGSPPKIEEIKTSFKIGELRKKIELSSGQHPYCLQLFTYGYLYWLKHQQVPDLSLLLVSTGSGESTELSLTLDIPVYEEWMSARLLELRAQAQALAKRMDRRKKMAQKLRFPFENPRASQMELIATIEESMKDSSRPSRLWVQAPTGLGKTVGVLYPVLKEALARGSRVLYVTPKNSQHQVAQEAVLQFHENATRVKSLTITAKRKICFKEEPLCHPQYCEYAKDHYTKMSAAGLPQAMSQRRILTAQKIQQVAQEHQVCPFALQFELAQEADVVICDYHYVFSSEGGLKRSSQSALSDPGRPNLVVDEAHNLPFRAMEDYSPALSTRVFEQLQEKVDQVSSRFQTELRECLNDCMELILECKPQESGVPSAVLDLPLGAFLEMEGRLRSLLSRYLDSEEEIQRQDPLLRLCFYWSEFTQALDYLKQNQKDEFFSLYQSEAQGGATVRIVCCDASSLLAQVYGDYEQVVGFSATLKPFEFYLKLSGLAPETTKTAEFSSPFPKEHRKVLIIPQVSTKYQDRNRNALKIADAMARISALKRGNYLAFFPSFQFLSQVLEVFQAPDGFQVLVQSREMSGSQVSAVLEELAQPGSASILFAVQGGVFSEGVDYAGHMAIGVFVVGPPLPVFDLKREQMRKYYEKNYRRGFDYAYVIPAMAKAVQCAGRVIRSEKDRGIIVLMDHRFLQPSYSSSMPADWFDSQALELVSNQILHEVREFWDQGVEG
ncbi:MAG: ATP-dependent DNA helicase [Bdellovibrionia bacterium]